MEMLWNDLRYGARMMLKKPGFTAIALITLALGIGATTAIFSVVNAVLLRKPPFRDADRLVLVWASKAQEEGWPYLPLSLPNFNDIREQSRSFSSMSVWTSGYFNLTSDSSRGLEAEKIQYAVVSSNLFSTLGVQPALGRDFSPAEDDPGQSRAILISHGLWQRRFGGSAETIGKILTLDGQSYEVAGVLPASFRFVSFPKETDVWLPLGLDSFRERKYVRGADALGVVARLETGTAIEEAGAELDTIAGRLRDQYPDFNRGLSLHIVPLSEQATRNLRPALIVLLLAVGCLLLIGCANVANLQLTRAIGRKKEIAVREALGASRWRIARQLLVENLLLGLAGGAIGLLLALWGVETLSRIPYNAPDMFTPFRVAPEQIRVDARVLGAAIVASLMTAFIFGLMPIVHSTRLELQEALKEAGSIKSGGLFRSRSVLVITEVALAMVLLVGAGLMVNSFLRLQRVDPGFDPVGAMKFEVSLSGSKYRSPEQIVGFYQRLLQRLSGIPEVTVAGAVQYLPLGGTDQSTGLLFEGQPIPEPSQRPKVHRRAATGDYFRAMGIKLREGRSFDDRDRSDSPKVAIVNETLVKAFWPTESPIGKRIALDLETMKFYRDRPPDFDLSLGLREIVGVVADVKHWRLDGDAFPEMYVPAPQRPERDMTVVVRSTGDPLRLVGWVRREVSTLDKDQPISNVSALSEVIGVSVAQPRFNTLLLSVFGALALVLAAVGIYGVISFSVAARTREIGIRMALGAQRSSVLRMVISQGLKMTSIGVAIGGGAALAMTRLMTSLLYGVSATDPLTFSLIACLLAIVSMAACVVPARRATRVDPIVALRCE